MNARQIITDAISRYKPVKVILMVSGGHDSVTNAHVSASILDDLGVLFSVYHGDTTIGIPDTQEYVKMICERYLWRLSIRKPPEEKHHYENLVAKYGFPGPTKLAHRLMYRYLKERALNQFVTYTCKSSPLKKENVLLLTGVRQDESAVRMGYTEPTHKDRSKIWCNPIFYWSAGQCDEYMAENKIPRNPVKEKICISGECLCGAFAGKEEWAEIKFNYPEVAKRIEALHAIAKESGKPWGWASGPIEWRKAEAAKFQTRINFMCVGCESTKSYAL